MYEKLKKKKKLLQKVEENYNNERQIVASAQTQLNDRAEARLEAKRKEERLLAAKSMKDYRRRIKELKQGYPEPKPEPVLTKEEQEKKEEEEKERANKEAAEREEEVKREKEKKVDKLVIRRVPAEFHR